MRAPGAQEPTHTVSTQTTAIEPLAAGECEPCASCGSPLAPDQRYCLECGARRGSARSEFLDTARPATGMPAVGDPLGAPGAPPAHAPPGRNANAVIAGVGVLLLAMGVGVLIGRAGGGSTKTVSSPPEVISVQGAAPATGTAAAAPAFTDDWPSATDGYTVQLQTLPEASTQPPAVAAAKAAATAKGANAVGALKSDDFSSLTPASYIVYAGVFTRKADADKALAGLRKRFPGATVIHVAGGSAAPAAGSVGTAGSSTSSGSSSGAAGNKPVNQGSGKSFEQKSKALPKQVSTGGAAPKKDNQAPGGGQGGGVSIG